MVDGMKIPIDNKVIDLTQSTEAPSYPMEDRLKMVRKSEIEDLKDKATKGNRMKFTVFNPQEKSNDILNETTSLEGNISKLILKTRTSSRWLEICSKIMPPSLLNKLGSLTFGVLNNQRENTSEFSRKT